MFIYKINKVAKGVEKNSNFELKLYDIKINGK